MKRSKSEIRAVAGSIALATIGLASMAFLGVAGAMLAVSNAYPQERGETNCGPTHDVRRFLHEQGQDEISGGLINERLATLIFATPRGERWTMVLVDAGGNACLVYAGQGWFQPEIKKGEPA